MRKDTPSCPMARGGVDLCGDTATPINQNLNVKRADGICPYDQIMTLPTVGEDIILPYLGEILIDKLGFIGELDLCWEHLIHHFVVPLPPLGKAKWSCDCLPRNSFGFR